MRRGFFRDGWNLLAFGDDDRLGHALVEGNDIVTQIPIRPRIMKRPNDRRIAPPHHPRDASQPPPVRARRRKFHQHLVALHGPIDLARWDKYVVITRRLPREGTHEPIAIAMQVEPPGHKVVTGPPG